MTGAAATSFPVFAAAGAAKKALIVSLHDVAPATFEVSQKIVTELTRHGVDVCSLLVVPDYHGSGASMKDADFVRWLRDLETAGHEIVIHGFFHRRTRREREALRERLLTRHYTKDEGEFHDLPYEEALRRITRARDDFRGAGLRPRGFIAPAWLLSSGAERAARDAEMEYTTRLTTILDLRAGVQYPARSLVYSVRSSWRRVCSLAWNRSLALVQMTNPLVRLAIHPPDFRHPPIWSQISAIVDELAAARAPQTYRDWIAEQRVSAADGGRSR